MRDKWNAFVKEDLVIGPTGSGVLSGVRFAVKDVFEIKDYKNTAGNPHWYCTHAPSKHNAAAIDSLLEQGASCTGTTHTDELMYSLNGENVHYGTPVNPQDPNRIPGGSSSGSAVAVAAGLVDFALGTDTGGSVRIPASYCGVYGFRPTHNAVAIDGVIPLAKSFDTVGWMAKDLALLAQIGKVLIGRQGAAEDEPFHHLYFDKESWSLIDAESEEKLSQYTSPLIEQTDSYEWIQLSAEGLSNWANSFRNLQGAEIWKAHGQWIKDVNPKFGTDIAGRFEWTSTLRESELKPDFLLKEQVKKSLSNLLKEDGLLIIPTAPGEAPECGCSSEEMEQYRSRTMRLTSIAGLSGFPQLTIPVFKENGLPIGLSIIANQNQDVRLLQWAALISEIFEGKGKQL